MGSELRCQNFDLVKFREIIPRNPCLKKNLNAPGPSVRATALSALANLTLLLRKNTLPFPAFGNYLNFVSPPHRRAYTSMPKLCPNIRFPHQQDFFPIGSVTKSSAARFSHKNLVEKFKIFVQDFVTIKTGVRAVLMGTKSCTKILNFSTSSHENLDEDFVMLLRAVLMGTTSCTKILNFSTRFSCENLAVEDFVTLLMGKKSC